MILVALLCKGVIINGGYNRSENKENQESI